MKRKTLVVVLVLMLFFGTSTAYAYWDQTQFETNNQIQIGVGATLIVTETLGTPGCKKLIPYGAFRGHNEVYEMVFGYDVELNKEGVVTVLVNNILIDGSSEHSHLVLVDVYEAVPNPVPNNSLTIGLNENVCTHCYEGQVFVRVTLLMPTSLEQYNAVAGKEISFDLEFNATEPTL